MPLFYLLSYIYLLHVSLFPGLQLLTRNSLDPFFSWGKNLAYPAKFKFCLLCEDFLENFLNIIRTCLWVPKACCSHVGWQSGHWLCITVSHLLVDTYMWPVTVTYVLSLKPGMSNGLRRVWPSFACKMHRCCLGHTTLINNGTEFTHIILTSKSGPSPILCTKW